MRILAVIPAYNEEACIAETVRTLTSVCPEVDYVVINDGSKDNTARICADNHINHINLPVNCGLSAAFQTGMKYALNHGYDVVVQFDADGQHLPEYIPVMAEALEAQHADIVIASRFVTGKKMTGARGVGSRLISRLLKLTSGLTVTDPTSGMRMYNAAMIRDFAYSFDLSPEPDALALLARHGAQVIEVPAEMQERQGGESYFDLSHIISYMTKTCLSIILFQWLR